MADVLVVDDDLSVREQFYDALSGKGYAVSTAGTGEQALEMLKSLHPSLVLLDIGLPGLSGLEVAERFRAMGQRAPIVFLAAQGDGDVADEQRRRLGVAEVMQKAWDMGRIVERLGRLMRPQAGQPG
jgi:DNA-binding response OmpR family regulator